MDGGKYIWWEIWLMGNIYGGKYGWWEKVGMGANQRSFEGRHMEPVTAEALTCSTVFTLSQKPSGTLHKCK